MWFNVFWPHWQTLRRCRCSLCSSKFSLILLSRRSHTLTGIPHNHFTQHRFVVSLAKDLREHFYPYFQAFLDRLIALLRTQDADQLEWTFVCLAFLVKNLKPFLKKDISVVFNAIMPLLDRRQPEHVTNFAAECFSFVARDIRDREKFLALVLAALRQHTNGVKGCGRLLYEMMRGVNGQLHSCTMDVLTVLLQSLRKHDLFDVELLHEVLSETVLNLLHSTNATSMPVFWEVAHSVLNAELDAAEAVPASTAVDEQAVVDVEPLSDNDVTVRRLLQLMGQAVEFRHGKMVSGDTAVLIGSLIRVIDTEATASEDTLQCAGELVAACLLCHNLTVTQLDASRVCRKVLAVTSRPLFEAFVWNVRAYAQFDLLVMPAFVQYYEQNYADAEVQQLLCRLLAEKAPPSGDGLRLDAWQPYALRFRHAATLEQLERSIARGNVDASSETLLMALQVWPHVLGADVDRLRANVRALIERTCAGVKEARLPEHLCTNKRQLFVLASLVEAVVHVKRAEWLPLDRLVSTLLPMCQCTGLRAVALSTLDQVIVSAAEEHITYALFERIHADIAVNLASEFHRVRLLSAHVLCRFGRLPELRQTDAEQTVYEIFVEIESLMAGVTTFREQLLHAQKLAADVKLIESLQETVCPSDALRYLLGSLYINFNLLWKPLTAIVATYAQTMPVTAFWEVFRGQLDMVIECIRQPAVAYEASAGLETTNNWLMDAFCTSWECTDRPDYVNYRVLLWRALAEFGTLSEVRNRDVVQLLLDFVEHEYRRSHENDTLSWNLLQLDGEADRTTDGMEVDLDQLDESTAAAAGSRNSNVALKGTQKTLMAIVGVFARLANPSQIHRHAEVYALYMELLCHRNPQIQKLALDCIMAHRHKFLVPYKDHLYGVIDEVKFKDAIQAFKIDTKSADNVVQPEHRADLMSIVVRILYSKMTAKVQKGGGQARKALVMRFLGACTEAEVLQLLHMAFVVYAPWLQEDAEAQVDGIWEALTLDAVLSPKKLQSTLNLIEIIREQFGGLMGADFQRYLLQIVFAVGAVVEGVLRSGDELVQSGHAKMFKQLRAVCQQTLANFCNHIDTYPWQAAEVEALFRLFVWPQLGRLPQEGIHAATPLLKLFTVFSKNPRYFGLLTRLPASGADDETPLRYMIDLLLEPKTKPLVCLAIMEMIQSLLQLTDQLPPDTPNAVVTVAPIPLGRCRAAVRPANLLDINFGSAILLPHMDRILLKFQQNVTKRRGLTRRDLHIVSLCTRLVTDSSTSERLLDVLLPILVRKTHKTSASGEEELAQAVETIQNLFERIDRPVQHIRSIAPMFTQITGVGPRKQLCDLLDTIAQRAIADPSHGDGVLLKRTSDIVRSLNAWDRRWVQQPDYEKRLGAFRRIAEVQEAGEMDVDLCLLAVYHCFYFVRHDKDLAMRDAASHHLRTMLPAMVRQLQATGSSGDAKSLDRLIDVVLNLLRGTISDSVDAVRSEGILLLGELARECADAHVVLKDLHQFTDKADREVDFFDNIVHMQAHRHGRALVRFCAVARTLERRPATRTLTQFVLPLATQYVCAERHAGKHGLVTAAIEAIGVVAQLLPWHQYEALLKYYLKKMRFNAEYQKQLVRLVMQILDGFHFDLSRAKVPDLAKQLVKQTIEEAAPVPDEVAVEENAVRDVIEGEEAVVLGTSDEPSAEDELDAELNRPADNDDDEVDAEEAVDEVPAPAKLKSAPKTARIAIMDQPIVLTHKAAKRLVHTIATGLIPQLNNAITTISTFESFHKLNKKKRHSEREEEEILRVPIALAMVKLLQKLPDGMLDHSLPGILLKVCQFLKSPLRSVRMCTRDNLRSIMSTVGTKHLDTLLQMMSTLLTRGFHVHVLTVTVHAVLDTLKLQLKAADIDRNLQSILAVILEDIFGRTADEKAVHKIGVATPEAKPSNKSYLSLNIVAVNVGESCLLDLLIPFKDQLQRTHSKSTVGKVQECCQQIVRGLVHNRNLSTESLLMFIYGTASESIPDLLPDAGARAPLTDEAREKLRRARPDTFLITPEPRGRTGAIKKIVRTNVRANAHVLVEFGLDLLHIMLKRGKLLKIDYAPFLDPVVPVLVDSLRSAHIRVTTYALNCLTAMWTHDMRLDALREAVEPHIVPEIFGVLHRYATAGISTSNENFGLVKNAFNAMVALLRFCEYYTCSEEQLRTLLLYVEQNLHDAGKQTIAFSLLRVIVGRKLLVAEMHEVMRKIGELVVTSESGDCRKDAKSIMVNYLMDYPLGKKVDSFLKFFVANLTYEVASGRESAIALVHTCVKRFPQEVLNQKAGFLFLSLGARLVNDESAECRRLVAECVETLIGKLTPNNRTQLFEIVLQLLADRKSSHREMAALLCTRFVVAEKSQFVERIGRVLPQLIGTLSTTGYKGT